MRWRNVPNWSEKGLSSSSMSDFDWPVARRTLCSNCWPRSWKALVASSVNLVESCSCALRTKASVSARARCACSASASARASAAPSSCVRSRSCAIPPAGIAFADASLQFAFQRACAHLRGRKRFGERGQAGLRFGVRSRVDRDAFRPAHPCPGGQAEHQREQAGQDQGGGHGGTPETAPPVYARSDLTGCDLRTVGAELLAGPMTAGQGIQSSTRQNTAFR